MPNCNGLAGPEVSLQIILSETSYAWNPESNAVGAEEMPFVQGTGVLPPSPMADIVRLQALQPVALRRRGLASDRELEHASNAARSAASILGLRPNTNSVSLSLDRY